MILVIRSSHWQMFFKTKVLISQYSQERPVLESLFFNFEILGLKACNFIKKKFQHTCFSVANFQEHLFSQNNFLEVVPLKDELFA